MKSLRFTFAAAVAAVALWSCEKAEPEMNLELPQKESTVAQVSPTSVIDGMSRATRTIGSILDEQLADVRAAAEYIDAAPDDIFPSAKIKEGVIKLLRSVIPRDTVITHTLPFVYSNIDNTFDIWGSLATELELAVNESTGLFEVGTGTGWIGLAHFETPSGDTYSISFLDSKRSAYKGVHKSSASDSHGLCIGKNGSVVFNIVSEDEKDKLPSLFLGSGLEYHHTHSGELSISAIDILLDYDVDFATGKMTYNFAMSMPLFADADTLLEITGEFQQKGFGTARRIESDQWFSMMDNGININVKSSDLRKMTGLMARTLLKDKSGYPEEFCEKLSGEWDTTASIMVYSGITESGFIHLGYIPANEDDPESELYVPAFLVNIYEFFGAEFTIPEFIELIKPLLPEI